MRVLDLGIIVQGPQAALLLGDLGAPRLPRGRRRVIPPRGSAFVPMAEREIER
jgi:hypothetical protein